MKTDLTWDKWAFYAGICRELNNVDHRYMAYRPENLHSLRHKEKSI